MSDSVLLKCTYEQKNYKKYYFPIEMKHKFKYPLQNFPFFSTKQ